MIVSKNRSGFTLIETLLALALFAMSILPILMLQTRMLTAIANYSGRMHRVMLMHNFMLNARREFIQKTDAQQFTLEKKVDFPETILRYKVVPASQTAAFKQIHGLYTERVEAEWREDQRVQQETIVGLLFQEPLPQAKG